MATTNYTLTNIAIKRVSGKAQVSINNNVNQELIGSSVQSSNSTVFGETVPNAPAQTLYLVQSASVSDPGTAMYVEFKVYPIGDSLYENDPTAAGPDDEGDTPAVNTYHAYALYLSSAFDDEVVDFDTHASTGTSFGSFPFVGGSYLTGSAGKFQLIPSFLSTDTSPSNSYIPTLYSNEGSEMTSSDPSDWYLDPFSGILFIQDPTQYGTPNGDGSSPNTSTSIPGKVRAFIYVGKYQDEVTFGAGDVNFTVSGSNDGFAVGNDDTINFVSGSAGVTVESTGGNTITIGKSTDNVTFNNITASIINADKIEATEYIVSSSITYMTQSFSSGSTIFGDTNDDTHQFTGSVSILHTGSNYGFQMSGSNFLIDYGDSGSVTLGEYNVGAELVGFVLPITGSGLIISQSFTNEATHHNMVKIGETELVDISGSLQTDAFLINVREKALVVSSSFLDKPVVRLANANHALYSGSNPVLSINPTNITLQNINDINLTPSNDLKMRVQLGDNNGKDPSLVEYIIAASSNPNANTVKFSSYSASFFLPALGGALTASAVSSSGLLFASLSGNPTHNDGILAIVYDTGSGQFYYTGSYGAGGGDTTDLEASASAGIHFSTGSGTGTSIGLMQTASFTSSGAGLGVDLDGSTFTYTLTPQDVFDAFDTANTGSFTASYANTASFVITASHALTASTVQVTNSAISQNYGVVFADNTGSANLLSDQAYGLTFNPSTHKLIVSGTDPRIIIDSGDSPDYHQLQVNKINFTGSTYQLIDSQGPNDNIDTTINFGVKTHTINIGAPANHSGAVVNFNNDVAIAGSASIEGDLIVRGAVTSIETDNLNVTDQFILLNSGSTSTEDGGIIITRNGDGSGPALFLDSSVSRFAVAKGVAWNNTSEITQTTNGTMEYLVSVSSSDTNPTTTIEWGDANTSYGQMFVNSGTGEIFIYG